MTSGSKWQGADLQSHVNYTRIRPIGDIRELAESAAGADLPRFVKDEFDAFLECGILIGSADGRHENFILAACAAS